MRAGSRRQRATLVKGSAKSVPKSHDNKVKNPIPERVINVLLLLFRIFFPGS